MLIEACGLAQLQTASELGDCAEHLVLLSDGKRKKTIRLQPLLLEEVMGNSVLGLLEVGSV